jgi:hypothetical protein
MTGHLHDTGTVPGTARRSDAGVVRLGQRDIDGLILCAEHYGAPYDLLAAAPTRAVALQAEPPRGTSQLRSHRRRTRRAGR